MSGAASPGNNLGRSAALARNWGAIALRGAIAILLGVIAFAAPGDVMLTLALVFAAYLIVDGVFAIVAAARAATHHGRWAWLLAEGAVNLIAGVVAALFPAGAVFAFVLFAAAWALISGAMMLAAGFSLHPEHGRVWLVLGGLVSLAWGAMLIAAPLLGAVVLTWWLGGYAIAFGVMLLALAFRLRARHAGA